MFQFLAISTRRYGTLGCRRTFPRHLLHRITTLVFAVSLMLFAQLFFTTPLNAESRDRPNIVLILADDQGYKDVAAHGHPYIDTPNMDRLFTESLRLTDFHVRPTCAPTRAALMSGRHPMRSGIWHTIMGRSLMRGNELTLAEVFQANGYQTGMFGKWHLGDNYPMRPQDQGFSTVVQHLGGGVSQGPDYLGNDYFDDHYSRNGNVEKFEGFCTDIWFDEAMQFMDAQRDSPFFVYLATNAPHRPWNVDPKLEQVYLDKGVAKTAAPYYALISNIDDNLGRLRKFLQEKQLADNTILLFMTDNGPAGGWPLNGDMHSKPLPHFTANMRGAKGSLYEGGHRVPCFIHWPDGQLSGGKDVDLLATDIDILPTLVSLTGVKKPDGPPLDGIDLSAALQDRESIDNDRIHVIQSQRLPLPSKEAKTAVLKGPWRLVLNASEPGSVELYNIAEDPRQSVDLAQKHSKLVTELQAAYDDWFADQSPMFSEYSRIAIGAEAEPVARLMSHDWLTTEISDCIWNQAGVIAGQMGNGPWAIEVLSPGTYQFELRRWPTERPGPIEADHAKISIGETMAETRVEPDAEFVQFELDLPAGPAMLQTMLRIPDRGNQTRGAYYVYVRKLR